MEIRLVLFLLIAVFLISCKKDHDPVKYGDLKGTITNAFDQPLEGAVVAAATKTQISDAAGSYSFKDLPVGLCQVSVTIEAYLFKTSQIEIIGNTDNILDFILSPGENSLLLSDSSLGVYYSSSHKEIVVTSNSSWQVSESASWLECSVMSGEGNGRINITWSENTGSVNRSDSVLVISGNITRKIIISQGTSLKLLKIKGIMGNEMNGTPDSALLVFNRPVTVQQIVSQWELCLADIQYHSVQNGYGVKFTFACADLGGIYPFKLTVKDQDGITFNETITIPFYDDIIEFSGYITDFFMTDDRQNCWIATKNPDRLLYISGDSLQVLRSFNLTFHPWQLTVNPYNQLLYVLSWDPDTYDYESTFYIINPNNGTVIKAIQFPAGGAYGIIYPYSIGFTNTGYGVVLVQDEYSSGIDWRVIDSAHDDTIYNHEANGYGTGQFDYFAKVYVNYDRTKLLMTEPYGSCEIGVLDGTTHEIFGLIPSSCTRGVFITPNMTNDRIYFGQLYDQFIMDLEGNLSQSSYKVNFGKNSADFSYLPGKENMIYWLDEDDNYLEILDYGHSVSPFYCGALYGMRGLQTTLDGRFLFAYKLKSDAPGSSLYKFNTADFWRHAN
jgi:hypothetical protein